MPFVDRSLERSFAKYQRIETGIVAPQLRELVVVARLTAPREIVKRATHDLDVRGHRSSMAS